MSLPNDAQRNRAFWDAESNAYQQRYERKLLDDSELYWGWPNNHEDKLRVLGDVAGKDVLEYGCGAAQWSILLARRGARPVALDNSDQQLEHARRLMATANVEYPLVHAPAEEVPLPDASFDIVFCEYGAMSFADPYQTVPECARLLRPGGLLAFMMNSPIVEICWPSETDGINDRLSRDYFGLHQIELGDHVEYQLPYGEWIRLFRANGFAIDDLIELQTPEDPAGANWRTDNEHEWGRRWPAYHIWRVVKEL